MKMAYREVANCLFVTGMILRLFILIKYIRKEYCFPEIVSCQTCTHVHTHPHCRFSLEREACVWISFWFREESFMSNLSVVSGLGHRHVFSWVASLFIEFIVCCEFGYRCRDLVSILLGQCHKIPLEDGCVWMVAGVVRCRSFRLCVCSLSWAFSYFHFNREDSSVPLIMAKRLPWGRCLQEM